jgi:hypothetical protein
MEDKEHEHLIYDSGRGPLFLRVPIAVMGIFMLWPGLHQLSYYLFGDDLGIQPMGDFDSVVPAFLALLGLELLFISVWFRRKRILFDVNRRELIVRSSTPFGERAHRISLSDATGVHKEYCHGMRGNAYWNIGIAYKDDGQCPLARAYDLEDDFTLKLSVQTQLPILENPNSVASASAVSNV